VELPEWLPLKIVVKLIARFEEILLKQIETLTQHRKRHGSGDGLNSDFSEGEDDAGDAIGWDSDDSEFVLTD